jgi:hypothetical protein
MGNNTVLTLLFKDAVLVVELSELLGIAQFRQI